jgi:adenylate cyclase
MGALFLQETSASIVVFDLRGFSALAATLSPLDLGTALGHFYTEAEAHVLEHNGRVVKFAGDAVIAAWLAHEVPDHNILAMATVAAVHSSKDAWLERNRQAGFPPLDYSISAATGPVLAGQIGTERMKNFDVLGEPVNIAVKLTTVATARGLPHLTSFAVREFDAVEVEGIELGGKRLRLFRLE